MMMAEEPNTTDASKTIEQEWFVTECRVDGSVVPHHHIPHSKIYAFLANLSKECAAGKVTIFCISKEVVTP